MTDRLTAALDRAKRLGADAARIHCGQSESIDCSFENARLKSAGFEQSLSYEVDVLRDGLKGSARGNDPADIDEIVSRAVELAKFGSAAHFDAYPAPAPVTEPETHSPEVAELPREKLTADAGQIVSALKDHDPELWIAAHAYREEDEGVLVTTGGVCSRTRRTSWSLGGYVQRTEGTDMLFAGCGRAWGEMGELWDPAHIASKIVEDLRNAETIADSPSGKVACMFAPEVFGQFLRVVMMGVNGRNVAKGDSPLRGRLGEKVFDEALTIVDDPHMNFRPGARAMDNDGVPTRRIAIVENGVLNCFLYDLDSAGLAGAEPTGNRGCGPYGLDVPGGDATHEELLSSVSDGVYVKQLMGFGQSNVMNGDFSCNVALGYRVRDGKMAGRVKNTMVAGNIYDLLASGVRLSSDREPGTFLPYALLDGVSVLR